MKFKVTGMDADDESNIDNNGNVLGAKGGTEMMREGLLSRLNPSLSDKFNIISSMII